MRKLALALVLILAGSQMASAQHYCRDGHYSSSNGSGTCSHHGGQADR